MCIRQKRFYITPPKKTHLNKTKRHFYESQNAWIQDNGLIGQFMIPIDRVVNGSMEEEGWYELKDADLKVCLVLCPAIGFYLMYVLLKV
jgi:hypothetical protein